MLVRFGNPKPHQCVTVDGAHAHEALAGPVVTYVSIPDGDHVDGSALYGVHPCDASSAKSLVTDIALHLVRNPDVTRIPGHEAFLCVAAISGGLWQHHSAEKPSWVWSDNSSLAHLLSAFYQCSILPDKDLDGIEETHHTLSGPPGVVPAAAADAKMNITQNGRDMWAAALGGGLVGVNGVSTTAPGATTYTLDGVGAPGSTTFYNNQRIIAGSSAVGCVWGQIKSNTNASPPVLTVDRWYNAATPGGAAATTPVAGPWVILDGRAPAWFMGLTADTGSPASPSTATSLTSEITTASGGLIRKICPYAHSASANTYTLTPVFTANGSDSLPVTVHKIGVFNSMVVGDTVGTILFETVLSADATLSASGDQLTITETVTGT